MKCSVPMGCDSDAVLRVRCYEADDTTTEWDVCLPHAGILAEQYPDNIKTIDEYGKVKGFDVRFKPSTELERWGDKQQYHAEPHEAVDPTKGVQITARLLWMTPQPLQVLGAFNGIYSGKVFRDINDITEEEAKQALADCMATHLQAPLECIKFHFLLEGVDRAMTHQLVRQRTAVYGQESMRFAVVGKLADATTLPPSLQGTVPWSSLPLNPEFQQEMIRRGQPQAWRNEWDHALAAVDRAYHKLVETGMPAEEARGLLPHCTATRLHYVTDLRNLMAHAGNRLCTQAQFPWRILFTRIVQAIREYDVSSWQAWQYEALADSALFRPVCYQVGHCPFNASFDRECSIRSRVEAKAKHGIPSVEWDEEQVLGESSPLNGPVSQWAKGHEGGMVDIIPAINPAEWLANPGAART